MKEHYKDPAVAEHICRCYLLASTVIPDDLLETLRLFHAHGIERLPHTYVKLYPNLYYVLSSNDRKAFPLELDSLLPQQWLSAEELIKLFDHNSDSQILSYTGIHPDSMLAVILHSLRVAYNLLNKS